MAIAGCGGGIEVAPQPQAEAPQADKQPAGSDASADSAEVSRREDESPPSSADVSGVVAAAEPPGPTSPDRPPKHEPLPPPVGAERLSPEHEIWFNAERREVIIDGNISLRIGVLEMFACTRNTKEHESIISANTLAYLAHAALLRIGAKTGAPVQFEPEFAPPSGNEIEIEVVWRDQQGEMQRAAAQEWVRNVQTGKQMEHPWVFAGSWFAENEETGEKFYMGDYEGDFICVSNFTTATLDVPIESTQAQDGLYFEAFTERIPPLGAPVRMILRPKAKPAEASAPREEPPAE